MDTFTIPSSANQSVSTSDKVKKKKGKQSESIPQETSHLLILNSWHGKCKGETGYWRILLHLLSPGRLPKPFIWQASTHWGQATGSPCPCDINTIQTPEPVRQEFDPRLVWENQTQTGRLNPWKRSVSPAGQNKYVQKWKGEKSRLWIVFPDMQF